MDTEKVSIIVPVYNAEKTIERCVKSLVSQTYKNIEVILIDDGSKDNSLEMCKNLALHDDRIFIYKKDNSGVSDTRNLGIEKSTGNYIQFVDSDDYIEKNMCERLFSLLTENNADTVICSMVIRKDKDKSFKDIPSGVFENEEIAKKLISIYKTNYINSPCNKLYKKELIKEGFYKRLSLGEDLLFNLKYLDNCRRAVFINEPMYIYDFINEQSLTHVYRDNNFEIATKLYSKVCGFAKKHNLNDSELMPVREVYVNSVFYAIQDLFYYSELTKKQRKAKLKEWLESEELIECIYNTYNVSRQQNILCSLLKHKSYNSIGVFFKLKKLLSSIK